MSQKMILNKTTKIWLNYLFGIALSGLLLWNIYKQIEQQIINAPSDNWSHTGSIFLIIFCILLMPVNLGVETYKWKMMVNAAQPISFFQSFKSILGGIALSIITPNRIGEYPGRLLYLKRKNTPRLISISILAAFSQFITLFLFGIIGLCYYNFRFPGTWQKIILVIALAILLLITLIFFRFEYWAKYLEHLKWFRRFNTYKSLLKKFTQKEQLKVLGLTCLRFLVFTSQYLLLLYWLKIDLTLAEGYFTSFLFFWAIAVIPSIAFAELGIRGKVSLFLFQNFSQNAIGIIAATIGLWCINLVIPAVIGSFLIIRMRILK